MYLQITIPATLGHFGLGIKKPFNFQSISFCHFVLQVLLMGTSSIEMNMDPGSGSFHSAFEMLSIISYQPELK
jgi:hypothetical protein